MRDSVELEGVVLFAQPVGEYDRRLVILTRERGRITAFARGARRPKSALIAVSNPFVFAVFTLYEGRDAYTLVSADAVDYFESLPLQVPGAWYGFYFLELADYFGRENLPAEETVNLLYVALRALLRGQMPPELIRGVFEIRILTENGVYAPPDEADGLLTSARYAIRYAAASPLPRLFSFSLEEEAASQLIREASRAVRRAVDRTFKSIAVIEEMS